MTEIFRFREAAAGREIAVDVVNPHESDFIVGADDEGVGSYQDRGVDAAGRQGRGREDRL